MKKLSKDRMYQPLWEQIKQHKVITVQLQPLSISDEQAARQYRTFRKALSKEKYQDIHYRNANPNSKIHYSLDLKLKQVTFRLEDCTVISVGDL